MTSLGARARRALRHGAAGLTGLLSEPRLVREMWKFEHTLAARMSSQALPDLMAELTSAQADLATSTDAVREWADAAAAFDVSSPLGICLRRSLVRYYFLRRAGLPVVIHFGARLKETRDIGGHAWLTLNNEPYYEASENYLGFVVMYSYPAGF